MENHQIQNIKRRELKLSQEREAVMTLSEEKAIDAILDSKSPATLVQSFPDEDLFFLMHKIGPEDFLPILSMATSSQWEYILDVELWEKDRVVPELITKWMDLLFQADPDRLLRWMITKKIEFFDFYIFKNVDVRLREHDEDPGDIGSDYETIDDYLYIRIKNHPFDPADSEAVEEYKSHFIFKMLYHLAGLDHSVYQGVLFESTSILPAETEEELFRRKSVRLAEKGFLPYDEALGIYKPLGVKQLLKTQKKVLKKDSISYGIVPSVTSGMLGTTDFFTRVLKQLDDPHVINSLQAEFAGLCNQIAAADQVIVREKKQLEALVKKASCYISICLEKMAGDDVKAHERYVEERTLADLFRTGYALVADLRKSANAWLANSWYGTKKLPLSFWGEVWYGILGGTLIDKPQYYDNFEKGHLYRDFESLDDIESTGSALNHIAVMDELLKLMNPEVDLYKDRFLTCQNLILTSWIRGDLNIQEHRLPNLAEFKSFFKTRLFDGDTIDGVKAVRNKSKEHFLSWLAEGTGSDMHILSQKAGVTLELLFDEVAQELGSVSENDLDPKYINLFCIE